MVYGSFGKRKEWQVKEFIDKGQNVNEARADDLETPLMLAVWYGFYETTKLLLDAKANPDLQNKWGYTALMKATFLGNFRCVQVLLEGGADPRIRSLDGVRPNAAEIADKYKEWDAKAKQRRDDEEKKKSEEEKKKEEEAAKRKAEGKEEEDESDDDDAKKDKDEEDKNKSLPREDPKFLIYGRAAEDLVNPAEWFWTGPTQKLVLKWRELFGPQGELQVGKEAPTGPYVPQAKHEETPAWKAAVEVLYEEWKTEKERFKMKLINDEKEAEKKAQEAERRSGRWYASAS